MSKLFTSKPSLGSNRKRKKEMVVFGIYLIGLAGELTATELALDLSLGAVMLQVVG